MRTPDVSNLDVDTMELFQDRFCRAYRAGSEQESILLLEDGHCLRDHALAACKIRNTQKVQPFAASSLLTLVEMVDADMGITFLPEMARDSALLRNTRVRMYPLGENSHRKISLAWRKGSGRVEEFGMLGEFFRSKDTS